jgi:ABC-type transporter MlaC component
MPRKSQVVFLVLSACSLISSISLTNTPGLALESKPTVEALVGLFSKWSGSRTDHTNLNEAARYIDYKYMSRRALGTANWDKLSESQRDEFEKAFKTLIEQRYYPRWHRVFSKSKITYGKESVENGLVHLKTEISVGDDREHVDWELVTRGTDAKVVNLTVDGKDLIARIARRLQKRLNKSGFRSVMTWIRNRNPKSSDVDN